MTPQQAGPVSSHLNNHLMIDKKHEDQYEADPEYQVQCLNQILHINCHFLSILNYNSRLQVLELYWNIPRNN